MALTPPDPRALLREAGLVAKKSWGQNFLCDQNILAGIVEAAGVGPEVPVVELGAGLGALTFHLLGRGGRVLAIERDRDLIPLLRRALMPGTEAEVAGKAARGVRGVRGVRGGVRGTEAERGVRGVRGGVRGTEAEEGTEAESPKAVQLEILEADAAGLDYEELATRIGVRPVVCGNLPYQLSSRIMVTLADQVRHVRRAVLMVQREVADRLAARAGTRTFGLLSVLVQRSFDVEIVRAVPAGAFHPRPKVTSAVVRLRPLDTLLDSTTDKRLVATARAAFATRRKTLKNALSRGLSATAETVVAAVVAAGLDPAARAETLGVAEFARLGGTLAANGILD